MSKWTKSGAIMHIDLIQSSVRSSAEHRVSGYVIYGVHYSQIGKLESEQGTLCVV